MKVSIVHSKTTINGGYLSGKVDCIAVAATCFSIPVVSADYYHIIIVFQAGGLVPLATALLDSYLSREGGHSHRCCVQSCDRVQDF